MKKVQNTEFFRLPFFFFKLNMTFLSPVLVRICQKKLGMSKPDIQMMGWLERADGEREDPGKV